MPSGALLLVRAQTAVHPGTGASVGPIDLPIQREVHTGWPTLGAGVKGVLRDAYRSYLIGTKGLKDDSDRDGKLIKTKRAKADEESELVAIFGSDVGGGETGGVSGALSVTDMRILAFPVRSARGVFAWVTCPAVLDRLKRDCEMADTSFPLPGSLPTVGEDAALVTQSAQNNLQVAEKLTLEDLLFSPTVQGEEGAPAKLAAWLAKKVLKGDMAPADRLVIVGDNAFTFIVKQYTEVVTRIRLDYDAKMVKKGALFVQEFLPPETVLYSVLLATDSRNGSGRSSSDILEDVERAVNGKMLQFGGDETTGKGWCRVVIETPPASVAPPPPRVAQAQVIASPDTPTRPAHSPSQQSGGNQPQFNQKPKKGGRR